MGIYVYHIAISGMSPIYWVVSHSLGCTEISAIVLPFADHLKSNNLTFSYFTTCFAGSKTF